MPSATARASCMEVISVPGLERAACLQGHLADPGDLDEAHEARFPEVEGVAPVQVPAAVKGGGRIPDRRCGRRKNSCGRRRTAGGPDRLSRSRGRLTPILPAPAPDGGDDLFVPPVAEHQVRVRLLQPAGQLPDQARLIFGFQLQGAAVPAHRQAVAGAQRDEGVPGEGKRQGGQGRRRELHREGVLQGVEVEQAPVFGLNLVPGAGPEAAGVEIGGGDVQVAIVAGHLSRERPQPLPHPGQEAVSLDLQGHHRNFPAGPQIPAPGLISPAQPALLSQGPGQGLEPRLGPPR